LQPSSPSTEVSTSRSRKLLERLIDLAAVALLLVVAWRWLVAPRNLSESAAAPAPRAVYQRLDGGTFALYAQRGRMVFLDFFASWCLPCRAELPLVERFARLHPEDDVVLVDVGESRSTVAAFARTHGLHNVVLDPGALSSGWFGVQGFPTMIVVDPRGMIRAKWVGFNPAIEMAMANAAAQLGGSPHPERTRPHTTRDRISHTT